MLSLTITLITGEVPHNQLQGVLEEAAHHLSCQGVMITLLTITLITGIEPDHQLQGVLEEAGRPMSDQDVHHLPCQGDTSDLQ